LAEPLGSLHAGGGGVVQSLLDRVDAFPKNQRFVVGQRLADRRLRTARWKCLVRCKPSPNLACGRWTSKRSTDILPHVAACGPTVVFCMDTPS